MLRKVILAVLLLMCIGCSERSEISLRPEQTSTFDVAQAKEAFVRDYTAAVEARSETTRAIEHIYYTLADTDYTPLWDKAKNTENEHVLSIDVPLYSVSGAFVSDTIGENMRMATQKLIVIQSKKSGDTFSYLLTLCPDVACAEKYSDLNDAFTHLGDCSKFSGLAIYTSLAGELVAVGKYVNGTETGYVYVGNPEADQHALHHQAEHLMEYMKYYLSSGPVTVTRGGGEGDTIYEDLCATCLKNPCECFDPNKCQWCQKPKEGSGNDVCMCDYYDLCDDCGKPIAQEGDAGGAFCQCGEEVPGEEKICEWCNRPRAECICIDKPDTDFCDDCGNPMKSCTCKLNLDPTCKECGKVPCECTGSSSGCPKCGDITCTGCDGNGGSTTPSNPTDPDDDICEYCNYHCDGTCDAYCPICNVLKDHCDAHICAGCGKTYNKCDCK